MSVLIFLPNRCEELLQCESCMQILAKKHLKFRVLCTNNTVSSELKRTKLTRILLDFFSTSLMVGVLEAFFTVVLLLVFRSTFGVESSSCNINIWVSTTTITRMVVQGQFVESVVCFRHVKN